MTAGQVLGTLGCLEIVGLLIQRCAAERFNDKTEYMKHDDRQQQHPTLDNATGLDTMTQTDYRRNWRPTPAAQSHLTLAGQAAADARHSTTEKLQRKLTKAHHGLIGTWAGRCADYDLTRKL